MFNAIDLQVNYSFWNFKTILILKDHPDFKAEAGNT